MMPSALPKRTSILTAAPTDVGSDRPLIWILLKSRTMGLPMKLMATETSNSPTRPLNFQRPMASRMNPRTPIRLRRVGLGYMARALRIKGTQCEGCVSFVFSLG